MTHNPIICAIDTTDIDKALELASSLKNAVGAIKLGLEFFTHHGAAGVKTLEKAGLPIFLDLKFHDIPNTVSRAIQALSNLNIFMTTIHTSGGKKMMEDAAQAIADSFSLANRPSVVGVTVLTSLDINDLRSIGVEKNVDDQVFGLAKLAHNSGLDGVVCSALEIVKLREKLPKNFKLVVPGIRPAARNLAEALSGAITGKTVLNDDQKRVMTPKEAMDAGASYLVIGRPITEAADPKAAAEAILHSL